MARHLSQVQRRCALAHELVHIDMGHTGTQPSAVERVVDRVAAQRLVTLDMLIDTGRWATTVAEWAHDLWVTPRILHARIEALAPVDHALLATTIIRSQDAA